MAALVGVSRLTDPGWCDSSKTNYPQKMSPNQSIACTPKEAPLLLGLSAVLTAGNLAERSPAGCHVSPTEKRPLAYQRPKSREETPKEGGGNANALPHERYMSPCDAKCKGQITDC